jgi:hypothetical protein
MNLPHKTPVFNEAVWIDQQIQRYGPMIGGELLRQFLGYRTPSAFQRARTQESVGVRLFSLPGRQGMFALTEEACVWILKHRRTFSPEETTEGMSDETGGGQ